MSNEIIKTPAMHAFNRFQLILLFCSIGVPFTSQSQDKSGVFLSMAAGYNNHRVDGPSYLSELKNHYSSWNFNCQAVFANRAAGLVMGVLYDQGNAGISSFRFVRPYIGLSKVISFSRYELEPYSNLGLSYFLGDTDRTDLYLLTESPLALFSSVGLSFGIHISDASLIGIGLAYVFPLGGDVRVESEIYGPSDRDNPVISSNEYGINIKLKHRLK